jgi:uncharacterized protein (DUF697 family)
VGVLGLASRGAKAIRPVAEAVRLADDLSQDGGHIAVIPGDPAATRRLREILGTPAAVPSEDALAVAALTPGSETDAPGAALARRRRSGGGALAILVGGTPGRQALEGRLLDAVLGALGDELIAAGRRNPALRPAIGQRLVRTAARRSAAVGALPLPGVDMPVLVLIQVRLVADLAALHDRSFGPERTVEALAIVGAGFGWRALGRSAVGAVPVAGWAVQGTIAYGATRAIGEAALARLSAGHDLIEGAPVERARPLIDRVTALARR